MVINQNMAELIGIILGDGHIHQTHNLITIVGSLEDLDYYKTRVIPLFSSLFGKELVLKRRRDRNSYYLMMYSKEILSFLTKDMGLQRGSKKKASIPNIITSNKKLLAPFLCGLFDTDGCLKFSKQGTLINYYPRVQICLQKSPLAYQLKEILMVLGFSYGTWIDNRSSGVIYYQISGVENVEKWFKIVSPKNSVHFTKYYFWKKYGCYIPKSGLEFRESKLPHRNL